jgi:hypothetical protein
VLWNDLDLAPTQASALANAVITDPQRTRSQAISAHTRKLQFHGVGQLPEDESDILSVLLFARSLDVLCIFSVTLQTSYLALIAPHNSATLRELFLRISLSSSLYPASLAEFTRLETLGLAFEASPGSALDFDILRLFGAAATTLHHLSCFHIEVIPGCSQPQYVNIMRSIGNLQFPALLTLDVIMYSIPDPDVAAEHIISFTRKHIRTLKTINLNVTASLLHTLMPQLHVPHVYVRYIRGDSPLCLALSHRVFSFTFSLHHTTYSADMKGEIFRQLLASLYEDIQARLSCKEVLELSVIRFHGFEWPRSLDHSFALVLMMADFAQAFKKLQDVVIVDERGWDIVQAIMAHPL